MPPARAGNCASRATKHRPLKWQNAKQEDPRRLGKQRECQCESETERRRHVWRLRPTHEKVGRKNSERCCRNIRCQEMTVCENVRAETPRHRGSKSGCRAKPFLGPQRNTNTADDAKRHACQSSYRTHQRGSLTVQLDESATSLKLGAPPGRNSCNAVPSHVKSHQHNR